MSTNKQVERDAIAFGKFVAGGGEWQYALLAARNTFKGHLKVNLTAVELGKVDVTTFASISKNDKVSDNTVRRYRNTWDQVAPQYGLPVADDLRPGDEPDLSVLPEWTGHVKVDGTLRGSAHKDKVTPEKIAEAIKADPSLVAAAVKSDPKVAIAAEEALQEKRDELDAKVSGRKPIIDPAPTNSGGVLGDYLSFLDGLLAAGQRLDAIKSVRDLQAQAKTAMAKVSEEHGYTGRDKEVAVVREIWALAQETALTADNFIVQTAQPAE